MLELRTSIFAGTLDREVPDCSSCPGDEMCEMPLVLMGNGRAARATPDTVSEIPRPVVVWPDCPWRYDSLWYPGEDLDADYGAASPADWVQWAYERDTHKRRPLPRVSAVLIREWLRLCDLPKRLAEARAIEEAKQAREGGR